MLRTLSGAGWDELQLLVVEKLKVVMTAWSWASGTWSALTGAPGWWGGVCVAKREARDLNVISGFLFVCFLFFNCA